MEPTDAQVLTVDDQDQVKFDLIQGAIVIGGPSVRFWGVRGVRHLFLGAGKCFDLTCGVGGADRLFLRGASMDHQVGVCADVLTLRHAAHGTEVRLDASRGPVELVFDDGAVTLGSLWRSVWQASALLGVVGEPSACARATVASHVKAAPRKAVGALPEGALLQVEGFGGVETVYAAQPGPRVHLGGRLAEHKARLVGQALALGRRSNGLLETAYVAGPARLVFADGGVSSGELFRAVRHNQPWPAPQGDAMPALPRITAVALDVDSAGIGWTDDWPGALPSGLFGACRAGQVFEACVSLEGAVRVDGTPRLHLCVGGRHRVAQFSGGSGTDTLRFVYTVTEEDVIQGVGSETRGQTLTDPDNLDVEVGPVLTAGATIRALQQPPRPAGTGHAALAAVLPDDSGWQAMIAESERRLAAALALIDERYSQAAPGRRSGELHPDLELDLLLDIDLADLESTLESTPKAAGNARRRQAAMAAEQASG